MNLEINDNVPRMPNDGPMIREKVYELQPSAHWPNWVNGVWNQADSAATT